MLYFGVRETQKTIKQKHNNQDEMRKGIYGNETCERFEYCSKTKLCLPD